MATQIPNTAVVVTVDTSVTAKTLQLPLTGPIYGKIITIKDKSGYADSNAITITTQAGDAFEDTTSNFYITSKFGSTSFLAKSNVWYTLNNSATSFGNNISVSNAFINYNLTVGQQITVGTPAVQTDYTYVVSSTNSLEYFLNGQPSMCNTTFISPPGSYSFTDIANSRSGNTNITTALLQNRDSNYSEIWNSTDGSTFTYITQFTDNLDRLIVISNVYVAANSSYVQISADSGQSWSEISIALSNTVNAIHVTFDANLLMFGLNAGSPTIISYIANTQLPVTGACDTTTNQITFNNDLIAPVWVSIGSDTNSATIQYSTNASDWYPAMNVNEGTPKFFNFGYGTAIAYGNNIYIAVGKGGLDDYNIFTSSDGSNFNKTGLLQYYDFIDVKYDGYLNKWYIADANTTDIYVFTNSGETLTQIDTITTTNVPARLYNTVVSSYSQSVQITSNSITAPYYYGDGSGLTGITVSNVPNASYGLSSLSSIVSYGLSTVGAGAINPGVSSLSSIVAYGLSSIADGAGGTGTSTLSSIVSYGLSSIADGAGGTGTSTLSSIVSYGLSSVNGGRGISSLSSILSYGLSSVNGGQGISSLSSIVSYGLSSVHGGQGISSLSSILSYGLSSVSGGQGISSLSSILSYGLSSVNGAQGISSLSSIVSYGLSSVHAGRGISSLSSIVSYGLSSVSGSAGISSLSSIVSYGLSTVFSGAGGPGVSTLSSIVSYGLSSLTELLQTSSIFTNYISSGVAEFSTISTQTLLIGYPTSPLEVDVGVATPFINTSTVNSINGFFSCNVGIGRQAPYWYALDVVGSVRLQDLTITSNFNTTNLYVSNAYITDVYSSNVYAQYVYGDAQFMTNIPSVGVSSLSSIVSYGLSTVWADAINPGVSSLSSIVSFGLSSFITFLYTSNAQVVNSITLGEFNDAAIAEYGNDLIIYKGVDLNNRIYVQTPGSFVIETGAQPGGGWSNNVTYGSPVFSVGSNSDILLNGAVTITSNIFLYDSDGNLNTTFCNTVGSIGFTINQAATSNSGAILTITDGLAGSGPVAYGAIHIQQNSNGTAPTTTGVTIGGYGNNGTMAGVISKSDGSGADLQLMTTDNFAQGMKNRVTISANGSVGIGLSNPSSSLEVAGDTVIHGNLQTGSNNLVLVIAEQNGIQYYTNNALYSTNFNSNLQVNEVAYNGTTWVAARNDGAVSISSDLINWSLSINSPPSGTQSARTVIYGNNAWFLGGQYNEVIPIYTSIDNFYSYDSQIWYQGKGPNSLDTIKKVAYNSNIWVVIYNSAPFISYFTDVTMSINGTITNGFTTRGNYIYYNPDCNIWIALGKSTNNFNILYSTDASNFNIASNVTSGNNQFFISGIIGALSVDYGSGRFIVVGDDDEASGTLNNMYYSTDGINYSFLSNNIANETLGDIKYYSGSTWFASSYNYTRLYRSDDNGSTWYLIPLSSKPTRLTVANAPVFTNSLLGNTAINKGTTTNALDINGSVNIGSSNSGLIVATVGNTTTPVQLYQNNTLKNATVYNTTVNSLTDIATNGSIYVAVGGSNTFRYSYDGQTYYDGFGTNLPSVASSNVRVAFGSNLWVATLQSSSTNKFIMYSSDGISWNQNTNNFTNYTFTGLRYNGSYWLFTANGNTNRSNSILYTTNPLGNSNSFLPALTGGFTGQANAVEWNGTMWVATGSTTGTSNIQYSYDGRNWCNTTASFGTSGAAVAYGNGIWVAGGLSGSAATSIYTSSNGINFVPYGGGGSYTNIRDIKFIQTTTLTGTFYAVGQNGAANVLISSSNGTTWTQLVSQSQLFTRLALGYPYQQSLYVNGGTTTNALTVNGQTTLLGTVSMGGNVVVGGALSVGSLLSSTQRQIRYFTYNIVGGTSGYTLTNGTYTNVIVDTNYSPSNFSSTDWILTVAGYNALGLSNTFSNISGVYCAPSGSLWNYYITGQPGYKLSNITMRFIAYPANFILNTGTTTML